MAGFHIREDPIPNPRQEFPKRPPSEGSSGSSHPNRRFRPAAEEVRREILKHGFDRVGFARAGPAPHADRLTEWLGRGFAGEMDYMARNLERRRDPRRILPGARTVIATALHYPGNRPASTELPGEDRAFISPYAQGVDYHRVMERRLRSAGRALAACYPGHSFRYYVDTGPVLERAWAQEAGIGWIGKNTCAIDSERGSYFFIGSILTTLEISPDPPATNHCGNCRLCIDACPTGAIVEPFRLDSRLCISYLTIEHRGPVPEGLRSPMGTMVFGCDICQEVCPFNRPERIQGDPELEPRPENEFPLLKELATLESEEDFRARFPASAVRRARFRGFIRNVILAVGNSGRRTLLPILARIGARTVAKHPAVSEALRWALERLRGR